MWVPTTPINAQYNIIINFIVIIFVTDKNIITTVTYKPFETYDNFVIENN